MSLALQIAQLLLDIGAVGLAPVTFKSGIQSPIYLDNRSLPYHPEPWGQVLAGFQNILEPLEYDVIAGIEAAGIPHSAALGLLLQKPSVFVRKAAKEHGQQKRIEGGQVAGLRVLLVEDLVTTGGSSLSGVEALRAEGAVVEDCVAIVSYGLPEAAANFAQAQVNLHTLTTFADLWTLLKPTLSPEMAASIAAWLADPHAWSHHARH